MSSLFYLLTEQVGPSSGLQLKGEDHANIDCKALKEKFSEQSSIHGSCHAAE